MFELLKVTVPAQAILIRHCFASDNAYFTLLLSQAAQLRLIYFYQTELTPKKLNKLAPRFFRINMKQTFVSQNDLSLWV